ncbi:tRNA-dihydrouridine synthase family protein [Bacteriovoracaceae bacterium]|nr:tRNA-dihydrouridine synthase family protein [Bacteriovoracaceae bacterium]
MSTTYYAPMEGHTDPIFREFLLKQNNAWGSYTTDFLRIPSQGKIPPKQFIKHFGERIFYNEAWRDKTCFQILVAETSQIQPAMQTIRDLEIKKLDINLGCPSKKVCAHKGGSYLLSVPETLKEIISQIRDQYAHHLSVKIRLGFKDTNTFLQNLENFREIGVDQVIIHGRTRKQMYKGHANWHMISMAKGKFKGLRIIANGDIKNKNLAEICLQTTKADGVMVARGALENPWFFEPEKNTLQNKKKYILEYFNFLSEIDHYQKNQGHLLKRLKSNLYYLFQNYPEVRSKLLRSQSLSELSNNLKA